MDNSIASKREKPRLRPLGEDDHCNYGWLCECSHCVVFGTTAQSAYEGWQEMHEWLKAPYLVAD